MLYGGIGESAFDAVDPSGNSNDHHVCVGTGGGASFASLDIETLAARLEAFDFPSVDDLFRPTDSFAPFDCTGFTGADLEAVTVPGME